MYETEEQSRGHSYHQPTLRVYGDINALTQSTPTSIIDRDGKVPGQGQKTGPTATLEPVDPAALDGAINPWISGGK